MPDLICFEGDSRAGKIFTYSTYFILLSNRLQAKESHLPLASAYFGHHKVDTRRQPPKDDYPANRRGNCSGTAEKVLGLSPTASQCIWSECTTLLPAVRLNKQSSITGHSLQRKRRSPNLGRRLRRVSGSVRCLTRRGKPGRASHSSEVAG
jgi:hypothetical protein